MSPNEAAMLTAEVAIELGAGVREAVYRASSATKTFRHDNPGLIREAARRGSLVLGNNSRAYRKGGLARFANAPVTEPANRALLALDARHPALRDATTIHPKRVFNADERDRVLVSGINSAKTGRMVTKGPWAGSPMYHLTLEERATCPRSCAVWRECYGNGMPMAVRFRHTPELMDKIDGELRALAKVFEDGFVVRLHMLGDFPSMDYLWRWAKWSDEIPQLRIWGYTAHPADSAIGGKIAQCNQLRHDRWRIRFSVAPGAAPGPMQTSATWRGSDDDLRGRGVIVCPQQTGKTATCGTCGLCWSQSAENLRVLFLGHGREAKRRPR